MPRSIFQLSPLELIRRLTVDQWRAIDREYLQDREKFDVRPLIVLIVVAVSLSLQEYYGERNVFARFFPAKDAGEHWELMSFAWWSGWRVFGYVIIPIVALWMLPGERVRDTFLSLRGFFSKLWIYVGLFAVVLPAVLIASKSESFRTTYPFYKLSNRSAFDFWAWQAMYMVQFFSLEFFFRGFMLKTLAPRFGSGAIFVMVVPYCMIHFGKPLPETLGAIIAGIVLGTLAMRTRSIWGGAFIHVAVALTMDLLALSHCPPADSGMPCPSRGH